ncbi:hypothetical protein [Aquimarina spongiae]|uniref:Uncharacterized protein n=1 Tax=Aquimarina spongiae TaxID=570521 RepID=A0A1M6AQV2_9FLAO|nr:hypothetical protein [Aquimarina spongiae]SHI38811.1 hypothetical protein SAMN04488508_101424 [Aquimarina spongiae]
MNTKSIKVVLLLLSFVIISCQVDNDENEIISSDLQEFIVLNNLEPLEKGSSEAIKFNSIEEAQKFVDDFRKSTRSIDVSKIVTTAFSGGNLGSSKSSGPFKALGSVTVELYKAPLPSLFKIEADIVYPYCTGDGAIFNDLANFSVNSYLTGTTINTTWDPTTEVANYRTTRSMFYTVKGNLIIETEVMGTTLRVSERLGFVNGVAGNPQLGDNSGSCEPPTGGDDGHGGDCPNGSETR